MTVSSQTLLTILGMALVTYGTRAAGLLLMRRVTLGPRMKAWLEYIPGAILISIVAPSVATGGLADAAGALVTLLVALKTKSLPLAMVAGVAAVLVARNLTGA